MSGFGRSLRTVMRCKSLTAQIMGLSVGLSAESVWKLQERGCKTLDKLIQVLRSPLLDSESRRTLATEWIAENPSKFAVQEIIQLIGPDIPSLSANNDQEIHRVAELPVDELWNWLKQSVSRGDDGELEKLTTDQRKLLMSVTTSNGDPVKFGLVANFLASSFRLAGRYDESFRLCMQVRRRLGDLEPAISAEAIHGQALSVASKHPIQPLLAKPYYDREEAVLKRMGNPSADSLTVLARDRALMCYQHANVTGEKAVLKGPFEAFNARMEFLESQQQIPLNAEVLACLHISLGNWNEAEMNLNLAAKHCDSKVMQMKIELTRSNFYARQGELEAASSHAEEARRIITECGFTGYEDKFARIFQTISIASDRAKK